MGASLGSAMCGFHVPMLEEMGFVETNGNLQKNDIPGSVQLEQPSVEQVEWSPSFERKRIGLSESLLKELTVSLKPVELAPIETIDLSDCNAVEQLKGTYTLLYIASNLYCCKNLILVLGLIGPSERPAKTGQTDPSERPEKTGQTDPSKIPAKTGLTDLSKRPAKTGLIDPTKRPAKTHLYEICTAYGWDPPKFECSKDEGQGHLRRFTYKVTVQVQGASCDEIECVSEPKTKKKAAAEHAAEGALWCLKHLGY